MAELLSHREVIVQTTTSPTVCIIWLHGLGADGYDFVPVVKELENLGITNARYVFPHAKEMPVSINGGYIMPAWYDIKHIELQRVEDENGIRDSGSFLESLIEREIAQGFTAQQIILVGFSQGGAITYFQSLRSNHKVAGVITLSTYLPLLERSKAELNPNNSGLPFLAAHGTNDDVVPLERGEKAVEALKELGYPVTFKTYPMAHSVCGEELADIASFIKSVITQ